MPVHRWRRSRRVLAQPGALPPPDTRRPLERLFTHDHDVAVQIDFTWDGTTLCQQTTTDGAFMQPSGGGEYLLEQLKE